jgi:glycosyltransferase involved in cell wall biosynthesis
LTCVTHVITTLGTGGAEMMLKRLIEAHQRKPDYRHTVIVLKDMGAVGQQLQKLGIQVQAMEMRSLLGFPRLLWQLIRRIRATRPDIVQTWMYHADLLGGLAARCAGNRHVIWGVRCTAIPQPGLSATQIVVSLCSWLSRFVPSVIVCCAESARMLHIQKGYDRTKMVVISNGYDLRAFHRHPGLREQARAAFGFGEDDIVVGTVGRFDPLKDHSNFVHCAAVLASHVERVKFLMVGRNLVRGNQVLCAWIAESRLAQKFVLAGERSDIPGCLAAMDVFCLSSIAEGFPNVVCEAMAMKVPCVVTDVGDAAEIVGETGIVAPPRNPTALAAGLQTMLGMGAVERSKLGELARRRIEERYSIESISGQFETIYDQVTQKLPRPSSEIAVIS